METVKKDYYPAIDGLRALAAIGVVLIHVWQNSLYELSGDILLWVIPTTYNVVFLFMIISGFSMCCGYYEKILKGQVSLERFYSKRFWKIWPLFALMSLVEFATSPSAGTFYEMLGNMTLLFGFTGQRMSVIGVGWYIGATMIFYLIFPFVCTLLSSKKKAWLAFAAALFLNWLSRERFDLFCDSFSYDFVFFLTGGMVFLYRDKLTVIAEKYRLLLLVLCTGATACCYFFGFSGLTRIMVYTLCLVYALGPDRKLLDNPVTLFRAGISLEIYLCHMAVFRIVEKLGISTLLGNGWLSFLFTFTLVLAGSVIASLAVQKLLAFAENKLRQYTKKMNLR